MQTKVEAARIATGAGIPVVLTAADAGGRGAGRRARSARCFHPTGKRRPTRLLWLAHATEPQGTARARRRRGPRRHRAPRLAAAGRDHRRHGHLRRPATRSTWSTRTGGRSPAAWSTSTPTSCPRLLGRSTHDLKRELGAAYEREVVHRDDLVLL